MHSTYRVLSSEELILVAGGTSSNTVTVHGPPTQPPPPDPAGGDYGPGGPNNGGGGGGSSGPTSGPYQSPSATAAANAFADAHTKNQGSTALDDSTFHQVHDDLALIFDYANTHPNATIDVGHDKYVSIQSVVNDISNQTITITDNDSLTDQRGAVTGPGSDTAFATYISPQNDYIQTYINGYDSNTGLQYAIFHEIGHVIDYYESGNAVYQEEASANTAGGSLETDLGVSLLSQGGGVTTPKGGYD